MTKNKHPDHIPGGDYMFLAWATNFHTVCDDMTAAWGLSAARVTATGTAIVP